MQRPAPERPLRRRPKQLSEQPRVFVPGAGGAGGTLTQRRPHGRSGPSTADRPDGATAVTDEPAALAQIDEQVALEPAVREQARRIAARLAVPRPRDPRARRRGRGDLTSLPFQGVADDIDLDATLESLVEHPLPEAADVVVRDRVLATRSVVLAVDVSGSSKGERLRTAAATVGALAGELVRDRLAVIAFWSDAAILLELGDPVRPLDLLDQLLRIPARGLTNLAFPLDLAAEQLSRSDGSRTADARVLLLSDCVHNAGPDPRPLAARLPRLDVLLDTTGEKDVDLGRDLARAGHGRLRLVRSAHDVAPAVSALFRDG